MIEITSSSTTFRLSPYERENTPEAPAYDWIGTYVEYALPQLQTQFKASFNVGELQKLKCQLESLYNSLLNGQKHRNIVFDSTENQVNLRFIQELPNHVSVELTLRPESPADSVVVIDSLGIDESYFPALLSGLDEMINWQN